MTPTPALCLLLLVTALPARARGGAEPVRHHSLGNGLRVALHVDHARPFVAVALGYRVGWRDDPPGYSGLAHVAEHAMFEGSAYLGQGEYERRLQELGASFNATTGPDYTTFFAEGPRGGLERMLWLEAQRMARGLDAVDEAALTHVLATVANERDERHGYQAGPTQVVWRALLPATHPYNARDVGGSDHIDLDAVRWFVQTHYRPERAVLAIVGDFDPVQALAWARRYFGPVRQSGAGRPRANAPALQLRRGERHRWALRSKVRRLELVWVAPGPLAPGDAELEAIGRMLTRRLRLTLPSELSLRSAAGTLSLPLLSLFRLSLASREDHDPDLLEETGRRALAETCRDRQAFLRARAELAYRASVRRPLVTRAALLAERPDWPGAVDPDVRRARYADMRWQDVQQACRRWLLEAPYARVQTIHRRLAFGAGRRKSRRVR